MCEVSASNMRRSALIFYFLFFIIRFWCLILRGKLCCTFVLVTAKHVLLTNVLLGGWDSAKWFHGDHYMCVGNWLEQIIITVYVK